MKVTEDIKKLIIFRLNTLPADKKISIGSYGEFDREELIEHVKRNDIVGQKIVKVELEFLKAMSEGKFYE